MSSDAPRYVHNWMKEILKFNEKTLEYICPIFENGTYWLHSENVLLAVLADERQVIRSIAAQKR